MKADNLRKKLFELFSQNLMLVKKAFKLNIGYESDGVLHEINEKMYICPICMNGFLTSTLDQSCKNPLTLEDIPPKSLGGKPLLLTCKRCNNRGGYKFDHLINKFLKTDPFLRLVPNSEIETKLVINEGSKIKGKIKILDKNKLIFTIFTEKNPYAQLKFNELISNWENSKLNFSIQTPKKRKVAIALLRIGYLFAFRYFGNLMLLESNIHKLRDQIINPNQNLLPHSIILNISYSAQPGLHLLYNPEKYRSYLVVYEIIKKNEWKKIGVVIPGPGEDGWSKYLNINDIGKEQIKVKDITSKDYLINENLVNAYMYLWKNL